MKRLLSVGSWPFSPRASAAWSRADEKDAKAIVEKGIKALGGEDKLAKAKITQNQGQGHNHFQWRRP